MLPHAIQACVVARWVRATEPGPSITDVRDRAQWQTNTETKGLRFLVLRTRRVGSKGSPMWPCASVNWHGRGVRGTMEVRDRLREGNREDKMKREWLVSGWREKNDKTFEFVTSSCWWENYVMGDNFRRMLVKNTFLSFIAFENKYIQNNCYSQLGFRHISHIL